MYPLISFVVVALLVGAFFWRRFGTVFNPPSLCAFSLGGASTIAVFFDAQVRNGHEIHAGFVGPTGATSIIFLVGLAAFVVPWVNAKRKPHSDAITADVHMNRTILQLDVMVLTTLIVTWCWLGQIPILEMALGNSSINDHIANLQNLAPGVMMTNLVVATALSLYIASRSAYPRISKSGSIIFVLSIVTILIASAWQGNRQSFLIVMFFVVARNFLKWTETYGQTPDTRRIWKMRIYTLISIVVFIAGFIAINYVRLSHEGRFSGPAEIFLYYAWPVYNMVAITSKIGFDGTGNFMHILTELLPARLGGKNLFAEITPLLFEPTAPAGYFSYWYLSFGLKGVAAGSLLLSVVARYAFEVSVKSEHHLRVYLLILWNCAMMAVYSHFLSLAYFWVPLLTVLAVHFLSRLSLVIAIAEPQPQIPGSGPA
jgi:oligosaccharide repeat unit polymerase